jgi:D-arabinose 1-dehydrogenase-like Zn-dependent alcohol dehydrogenase
MPDGGHAGCTTTGVTFTNQTGFSSTIGASGTTLVHLPNAASMDATSSSGCQGATFSIPVSITAHKG